MTRIVIADDSATARMFTKRCVEVLGFKGADCTEVEDGALALEEVKKVPTDILITDLTMPVMDGTSLVKQIAESGDYPNLKIIVVTSAGNPAKEEELGRYGAQIISKPISPAKLAAVLSSQQDEGWG